MERNSRKTSLQTQASIQCNICNTSISKSNWSKHIKTKKHVNNILLQRNNSETYEIEN